MARQVDTSFVGIAHDWKQQIIIGRGPLDPRDDEEEARTAAVVGLTLTEVLKTVCIDGDKQYSYSQQLLDADIDEGLLVEQVVPRRASPVVWSPKTSQVAFFNKRPVATVNELIVRAIALNENENTTKLLPHGRLSVKATPVVSGQKHTGDLHPWARPYQPVRIAPAAVNTSVPLRTTPQPVLEGKKADDVSWKVKRQRLLQQDREQTPAQRLKFQKEHKGNTLRGIVYMMDTVTEFAPEEEQRRYVKLPSYVSRSRAQILSATTVDGQWQVLVDTCAELTLFGSGVPHIITGPSDVSLLGVGGTVVNADHKGSFVVVRETDKAIIDIVHGHMVTTLPPLTVILGWDPLLAEHPRANLALKKNNELLWMEEPGADHRIGWGLGRLHRSKLVQITDRYQIFASREAAQAAAEAARVNIVAESLIGVLDEDRHHSPRVTTSTVDQLPALPPAPGKAYAAWIVDKPQSVPEVSTSECPPPASVQENDAGSATSWSRNLRVLNVRVSQSQKKATTQAAKLVRDAKVRRSVGVRVCRETFEKEDGFVAPAVAVNKKAKQMVEAVGTTPVVQIGGLAASETVSAAADDDNKVRDLLRQLIETKQAQSFIASNQMLGHPCDSVDAMFGLVAHCHGAAFGMKREGGADGSTTGALQQQEASVSVRVRLPATFLTAQALKAWHCVINIGRYTPGELRRLMMCSRHFREHLLGAHPTPAHDPWMHCTAYGPRQPHRIEGQGGVIHEIWRQNAVNSRELVQELVCDKNYGWNDSGDVQHGPATQRHIMGTFAKMDSELVASFNNNGVMSVERVKQRLEKQLPVEAEATIAVATVTAIHPEEITEEHCSGGSGPAERVEGCSSGGSSGDYDMTDAEWDDLMSEYHPPGALCTPTVQPTCEAPKCAPPECTASRWNVPDNIPGLVDTSSGEDTSDDEEFPVYSMPPPVYSMPQSTQRVYARVFMVSKVEGPNVCPIDGVRDDCARMRLVGNEVPVDRTCAARVAASSSSESEPEGDVKSDWSGTVHCVGCNSRSDKPSMRMCDNVNCPGLGYRGLHRYCGQQQSRWLDDIWVCKECTPSFDMLPELTSGDRVISRVMMVVSDRPVNEGGERRRGRDAQHGGGAGARVGWGLCRHVTMRRGVLDPELHRNVQGIVQIVNCTATKPGGLAAGVQAELPYGCVFTSRRPSALDRRVCRREDISVMGTIDVRFPPPQRHFAGGASSPIQPAVVNCAAQYFPGGAQADHPADNMSARVTAFGMCLERLGEFRPRPDSLAFPNLIGCAIGGGDPVVYQGLIHRFAEANPKIAVYIVTFDPDSRERQQREQFGRRAPVPTAPTHGQQSAQNSSRRSQAVGVSARAHVRPESASQMTGASNMHQRPLPQTDRPTSSRRERRTSRTQPASQTAASPSQAPQPTQGPAPAPVMSKDRTIPGSVLLPSLTNVDQLPVVLQVNTPPGAPQGAGIAFLRNYKMPVSEIRVSSVWIALDWGAGSFNSSDAVCACPDARYMGYDVFARIEERVQRMLERHNYGGVVRAAYFECVGGRVPTWQDVARDIEVTWGLSLLELRVVMGGCECSTMSSAPQGQGYRARLGGGPDWLPTSTRAKRDDQARKEFMNLQEQLHYRNPEGITCIVENPASGVFSEVIDVKSRRQFASNGTWITMYSDHCRVAGTPWCQKWTQYLVLGLMPSFNFRCTPTDRCEYMLPGGVHQFGIVSYNGDQRQIRLEEGDPRRSAIPTNMYGILVALSVQAQDLQAQYRRENLSLIEEIERNSDIPRTRSFQFQDEFAYTSDGQASSRRSESSRAGVGRAAEASPRVDSQRNASQSRAGTSIPRAPATHSEARGARGAPMVQMQANVRRNMPSEATTFPTHGDLWNSVTHYGRCHKGCRCCDEKSIRLTDFVNGLRAGTCNICAAIRSAENGTRHRSIEPMAWVPTIAAPRVPEHQLGWTHRSHYGACTETCPCCSYEEMLDGSQRRAGWCITCAYARFGLQCWPPGTQYAAVATSENEPAGYSKLAGYFQQPWQEKAEAQERYALGREVHPDLVTSAGPSETYESYLAGKVPRYLVPHPTAWELHLGTGHASADAILASVPGWLGFVMTDVKGKLVPAAQIRRIDLIFNGVCDTCMLGRMNATASHHTAHQAEAKRQQIGRARAETRSQSGQSTSN